MRESFLTVYTAVKAKLSTLAKAFTNESKEAKEKIAEWERAVERYRLDEEFSQNPKVQELYGYYREKALAISKTLSTTEELSEIERKVLFNRRKEVYGFLQMLGLNSLKDIEEIERAVDFELDGLQ